MTLGAISKPMEIHTNLDSTKGKRDPPFHAQSWDQWVILEIKVSVGEANTVSVACASQCSLSDYRG